MFPVKQGVHVSFAVGNKEAGFYTSSRSICEDSSHGWCG